MPSNTVCNVYIYTACIAPSFVRVSWKVFGEIDWCVLQGLHGKIWKIYCHILGLSKVMEFCTQIKAIEKYIYILFYYNIDFYVYMVFIRVL